MDVTEEWVDTENIDSKNLNVQGPKYIHPDSDIKTRPQINSKKNSFIIAAKVGEGTRRDGETRHHSSSG